MNTSPRASAWSQRIKQLTTQSMTAASLLDLACESHPHVPLLHLDAALPYAFGEEKAISCQRILGVVNRISNVLRASGLKRYDRVAVYKTNSPDYLILALAIIRAGGIGVPVNGGMGATELDSYLRYTGAQMLITDTETYAVKVKTPGALPSVRTWIFTNAPAKFPAKHVDLSFELPRVSAQFEPEALAPDSDVLIVHTSGTTGFPKGVISTSGSFVAGLRTQFLLSGLLQRGRVVLATPFNHLMSHVGLCNILIAQIPTWTISSFDADRVLSLIDHAGINIFVAFPDRYLEMFLHGLEKHDLSTMKLWMATADTSHDVHVREFVKAGRFGSILGREVGGSAFIETLGTSEVGAAALWRFITPFSRLRADRVIGRPSPIGPAVKIADPLGRELPVGRVGRLMVKGSSLFKGYWNAHERLHGVLVDGWWWTGDLAFRDPKGRIHHLDRAADVVPTASGSVYTLAIEEQLLSHPDVGEAAVFGVPSPTGSQAPIAVVAPRPGHRIHPAECMTWLQGMLHQDTELQKIVAVQLADVPRGLTGKVLKRALRERYQNVLTMADNGASSVPTVGDASLSTHASSSSSAAL